MEPDNDGALVKGTEFTTASTYDPKVKAKAYELYLTTDYTTADIGIAVGVKKTVVQAWASAGGWRKRKLELEREEMQRAEDKYRQIILANRAPVAERHIRISGTLEEVVEAFANKLKNGEGLDSHELTEISKLKQLAEALTGASGVGARAVGISDRPVMDPLGDRNKKDNRRQPLIVIGVTAQPVPGAREAPALDVRVTDCAPEEDPEEAT